MVSYNKIANKIINKYRKKYIILFMERNDATCFLDMSIIFAMNKLKVNPSPEDIFILLHEIGHLETNNIHMCISLGEYLATKWAICEMKKYNFDISTIEKREWQEYIYDMRKQDIKDCWDNIPKKKELQLVW